MSSVASALCSPEMSVQRVVASYVADPGASSTFGVCCSPPSSRGDVSAAERSERTLSAALLMPDPKQFSKQNIFPQMPFYWRLQRR